MISTDQINNILSLLHQTQRKLMQMEHEFNTLIERHHEPEEELIDRQKAWGNTANI